MLKGLAPVTVLSKTPAGRAALGANYAATGGIQTGAIRQPALLPFADQQQQALRDAFITDGDLAELADGLGTTLGAAYQARAHYLDREHYTNVSPALADLIAYTNAVAGGESMSWLETVAIDPALQGRGIGTALVAEALRGEGVGAGRAGAERVLRERYRGQDLRATGFVSRSEVGKYAAARADLLRKVPVSA